MRFLATMLLVSLVVVASASASHVDPVIDRSDIFADFNVVANNVACPAQIPWYSSSTVYVCSDSGASCGQDSDCTGGGSCIPQTTSTPLVTPNSFWPTTANACNSFSANYALRSGSSIPIHGVNPVDATARAALTEYDYMGYDNVVVNKIPYTSINKQQSDPATIMKFSWCGENVHNLYTTNTVTPSSSTMMRDDAVPQECDNFYRKIGGTGSSHWAFFENGEPGASGEKYYYTLTTLFTCDDFFVRGTDYSDPDWDFQFNKNYDPTSGLYYFTGSRSSNGVNSMTVSLITVNKRLKSVKIDGYDMSSANGGNQIVITCKNPTFIDPDNDKATCQSNPSWDWSQTVADADTAASLPINNACCGDEGDPDTSAPNSPLAEQTCTKNTDGTFKWIPAPTTCLQAQAYTVDKTTNPNDMKVCLPVGTPVTYKWIRASTETIPYNFTPTGGTKELIISNGTAWYLCGNTGADIPAASATTLDTKAACSIIRNTKKDVTTSGGITQAPSFVCHGDWKPDSSSLYMTGTTSGTPPVTTYTALAAAPTSGNNNYVCTAGAPVPTIIKPTPNYDTQGPCAANTCYYNGPQATKNKCIPINSWVRDDLCVDDGSGKGVWTKRTRLLADSIVPTTGDFILHCDDATRSINVATAITGLTTSITAPLTNNFCALSTIATATSTRTIGTTLNHAEGVSPDLTSDATAQPPGTPIDPILRSGGTGTSTKTLASLINDAAINVTPGNCKELAGSIARFQACALDPTTGTGVALYDSPTQAILASSTSGFAVSAPASSSTGAYSSRFAVANLVKPLSGIRFYTYSKGTKSVDAVLQYISESGVSKQQIVAIYTGVDPTSYVNKRFPSSQVTITTSGSSKIVIVKYSSSNRANTNIAADWNYLTLRVRP